MKLSDEDINKILYKITDPCTPPMTSIAASNIVIVELLTRLVDTQKSVAVDYQKCIDGLMVRSFSESEKDPLAAKIVEALDLAEQLLKYPDAPILNGYDRQSNLVRFGSFSQHIRNELANREKEGREL